MKITINENQEKINFKTHVGNIITMAKKEAEYGCHHFYYHVPKNQGIDVWKLINTVEQETENTVYGGHKCYKGGEIRFTIRD